MRPVESQIREPTQVGAATPRSAEARNNGQPLRDATGNTADLDLEILCYDKNKGPVRLNSITIIQLYLDIIIVPFHCLHQLLGKTFLTIFIQHSRMRENYFA